MKHRKPAGVSNKKRQSYKSHIHFSSAVANTIYMSRWEELFDMIEEINEALDGVVDEIILDDKALAEAKSLLRMKGDTE